MPEGITTNLIIKIFIAILFTAGYIKICDIMAMTSRSHETIAVK